MPAMSSTSVVEFIGLPGAGKTSTASALHEVLARSYSTAFPERQEYRRRPLGRAGKLALDVRYAPQLYRYRLRRTLFELRARGPGPRTLKSGWKKSRFPALLLDYKDRHPAQVFILDEWLVHKTIAEAFRRYPDDLRFCTRFATWPFRGLDTHYVAIDIDPQAALHRILYQDHPHRTFLWNIETGRFPAVLEFWQDRLGSIMEELLRRGLPVLTVSGLDDVRHNADRIATWLTARLKGPTPPPRRDPSGVAP
jgi:hypothetical protein